MFAIQREVTLQPYVLGRCEGLASLLSTHNRIGGVYYNIQKSDHILKP